MMLIASILVAASLYEALGPKKYFSAVIIGLIAAIFVVLSL